MPSLELAAPRLRLRIQVCVIYILPLPKLNKTWPMFVYILHISFTVALFHASLKDKLWNIEDNHEIFVLHCDLYYTVFNSVHS